MHGFHTLQEIAKGNYTPAATSTCFSFLTFKLPFSAFYLQGTQVIYFKYLNSEKLVGLPHTMTSQDLTNPSEVSYRSTCVCIFSLRGGATVSPGFHPATDVDLAGWKKNCRCHDAMSSRMLRGGLEGCFFWGKEWRYHWVVKLQRFLYCHPYLGKMNPFWKNKLRKWGWFNHQLEGHWLSFCSVDFMKDFASPLEHDCVELSGRRVVRSQNKQVCQVVWRWSNTIDSEVFDDFEEFWHVRYIYNAILKNRS